jgi:hypothetical protein|tara:strand:+ start:112 stop:918 length:807 start_codon:yes stop_codon:yes gene_type:complete
MSNIKKINLSTPGRILDAGDIRRKKNKLKKTKEQLKNLDPNSRKYHRKSFKIEKTEGQLESGRAGIGSFKMPYNSAIKNERALSQKQKDSLHSEANKYGKAFFSPKFNVNVDPEDGVLTNRPTFKPELDDFSKLPENQRGGYTVEELESLYPKSEGRQLTYPIIDKPYSNAAPKQTVSSSGGSNLDEFLKRIESRKIKNPEYADVEGPEYSKSYNFFIANRSPESDSVAIQMDSLNKAVMNQAKTRQFEEMKKTRAYQQELMNKYNID